jgi:hypothetical protein
MRGDTAYGAARQMRHAASQAINSLLSLGSAGRFLLFSRFFFF